MKLPWIGHTTFIFYFFSGIVTRHLNQIKTTMFLIWNKTLLEGFEDSFRSIKYSSSFVSHLGLEIRILVRQKSREAEK